MPRDLREVVRGALAQLNLYESLIEDGAKTSQQFVEAARLAHERAVAINESLQIVTRQNLKAIEARRTRLDALSLAASHHSDDEPLVRALLEPLRKLPFWRCMIERNSVSDDNLRAAHRARSPQRESSSSSRFS